MVVNELNFWSLVGWLFPIFEGPDLCQADFLIHENS